MGDNESRTVGWVRERKWCQGRCHTMHLSVWQWKAEQAAATEEVCWLLQKDCGRASCTLEIQTPPPHPPLLGELFLSPSFWIRSSDSKQPIRKPDSTPPTWILLFPTWGPSWTDVTLTGMKAGLKQSCPYVETALERSAAAHPVSLSFTQQVRWLMALLSTHPRVIFQIIYHRDR